MPTFSLRSAGPGRAWASNLLKISNDLRLLSSGPDAGFGEIRLPPLFEAGSSIMPGKVNPVIPEAIAQAAIAVMGHDQMICQAVSGGNLELSQFLPLVADSLLGSLDLLTAACDMFARQCVAGSKPTRSSAAGTWPAHRGSDRLGRSLRLHHGFSTVQDPLAEGKTVRQVVIEQGLLSGEEFATLPPPIGSRGLVRWKAPPRSNRIYMERNADECAFRSAKETYFLSRSERRRP